MEYMARLLAGHKRLTPNEEDACQIVYEILLNYEPGTIEGMHQRGELDKWLYKVTRYVLHGDRGSHSVRRLHAFTELCEPLPPGI